MNPSYSFREVIAAAVVVLFAWAFYKNPTDEIIIGSLLTAFATAIGFYLGGSKVGSDTAAQNADTVAAQAKAATDTASGAQEVTVVNPPEDPVQTKDAKPSGETAQAEEVK